MRYAGWNEGAAWKCWWWIVGGNGGNIGIGPGVSSGWPVAAAAIWEAAICEGGTTDIAFRMRGCWPACGCCCVVWNAVCGGCSTYDIRIGCGWGTCC